MNAVAPFSSFSIPERPALLHFDSQAHRTALKTQTLWNRFLSWIGMILRDWFFLPLPNHQPAFLQSLLQREEEFVTAFWDPNRPVDLNYPHHLKIREAFTISDQPIRMQTDQGETLELICRVIESKVQSEEKSYNCLYLLGNLATLSTNITAAYPYLASYLDHRENDPMLPPARFILISQYDMKLNGKPFKPRTLEEAGSILKKTCETLVEAHGPIDHAIAQSLGGIILGAALKQFDSDLTALPQSLHFDRTLSSIDAASKPYTLGAFLNFMAKYSGWSIDIGQTLSDFYKQDVPIPCLVSGVKEDFVFPGPAGLHEDPRVKELNQATVWVFDPPRQLFHVRGHHGLRADYLNGTYLIRHSNRQFLKRTENLANASLSRSIRLLQGKQQRSA